MMMMATDDDEPPASSSFLQRNWVFLHILCFIITAIASLGELFHFYFLQMNFKDSCPLYGNPALTVKDDKLSFKQLTEDHLWGDSKNCSYVFFTSGLSFVISFLWCWFFCYCHTGMKSDTLKGDVLSVNQQWYIIPPVTVCCTFLSLICLVSSCILSNGLNIFCNNLKKSNIVSGCSDASHRKWEDKYEMGFFTALQWSIIESWLTTVSWIGQTVMLWLRCYQGPGNGYGYSNIKANKM